MTDFMKQVEKEVKEDRELARLVKQEELILDVTELILEKMEEKGLNKSQLANMLGTNKSHVTQLLRGSRNMTLRTVSDIFFNLGCEVTVKAVDNEEQEKGDVFMQASLPPERSHLNFWMPHEQPQVCKYPELESMAA